ncbi:MAG: molybdenum cofactor guanylyltransferase [Pirellulaceae bacterium]
MPDTARQLSGGSSGSPILLGGILIGGRSSRMGTCKATLRLPSGETLLDHALGCLQPHCDEIVISAADASQVEGSPLKIVIDEEKFLGPASGVAALLREAESLRADAVLVLSVDLPRLRPSDLQPLVDAWCCDPQHLACGSFGDSLPQPLVAIYPTRYVNDVSAVAASSQRGLLRWLRNRPHQRIALRPQAGCDVDTPQQWQSFISMMSALVVIPCVLWNDAFAFNEANHLIFGHATYIVRQCLPVDLPM